MLSAFIKLYKRKLKLLNANNIKIQPQKLRIIFFLQSSQFISIIPMKQKKWLILSFKLHSMEFMKGRSRYTTLNLYLVFVRKVPEFFSGFHLLRIFKTIQIMP